ncbi:MAG TPA: AprI/Inh family metalloprotease inhibitor [Caulobacteraceae bacterium]|nr:AprI/Inh family metalloprotease inhibitor [Caulobacteraceae bacterium]
MNLNLALPLAAALFALARAAFAADHEAGVPLSPAEAAGAWTVESGGHAICMLRLTARHDARVGAGCGEALPSGVTNWAATSDGMALTSGDGQVLAPFDRWSNSLFVSRRSSGVDVQLMRGPPHPEG